jgi:F0F1-type ATP synthase epsilon subunit
MRLGIYSLQRTLYDGEATSLTCQTELGEITVLDHHRPFISVLAPGQIKTLDNKGATQYFEASSGFIEVGVNNSATLIVR